MLQVSFYCHCWLKQGLSPDPKKEFQGIHIGNQPEATCEYLQEAYD